MCGLFRRGRAVERGLSRCGGESPGMLRHGLVVELGDAGRVKTWLGLVRQGGRARPGAVRLGEFRQGEVV